MVDGLSVLDIRRSDTYPDLRPWILRVEFRISGRTLGAWCRQKLREHISDGFSIAVEVDLEKYFDTVNHDVRIERVERKVRDIRTLRLIGLYLRAAVLVDRVKEQTRKACRKEVPCRHFSRIFCSMIFIRPNVSSRNRDQRERCPPTHC